MAWSFSNGKGYLFQNTGENRINTVKISSRPAIIRNESAHFPKSDTEA
jgi:hypothetical protein